MQLISVVALALFGIGAVAAPQYPGAPKSSAGSYPGAPGSGSGGYPGSGGSYPGSGSGGSYPGSGSGGSYPGQPSAPKSSTSVAKASSAAPAPATSAPATSAPATSAPATTANPAPPGGAGAPIFESFTVDPAATLAGGVIGATAGPAGGAIGGTGAFVNGQPQATGSAAGSFAGASGALQGGVSPSQLAGCAGGEDSGFGYTQCFTAPLMPRATEAPRPSGAPGFFETFTYTTGTSVNLIGGALGATGGSYGGAIGGTAIYQNQNPAATGSVSGSTGSNNGKLQGGIDSHHAAGCAAGDGFSECVTLKRRATQVL